jgi:hypothetical protein
MKKVILLVVTILAFQMAKAQDVPFFDLGIKAGMNGSWLGNLPEGADKKDGLKYGFVAGVFARIKIPLVGLYVQPEAVITQSGSKMKEITANQQVITPESTTTLTNFEIPILLGQRFGIGPLGIRINAGPDFITVLSAKSKVGNADKVDIKDKINTFQVGLQAGVGVDISKFNFDLRYQHNFTQVMKEGTDKSKINLLQLTVGFKIL